MIFLKRSIILNTLLIAAISLMFSNSVYSADFKWTFESIDNQKMIRYDDIHFGVIIECEGKARIVTFITSKSTKILENSNIGQAVLIIDGNIQDSSMAVLANAYRVDNTELSVAEIITSAKFINKAAKHSEQYLEISFFSNEVETYVFKVNNNGLKAANKRLIQSCPE